MLLKNGCGLLGKSAVSQEWIDEMSWFFAYPYKFKKAKNYFNNYWLGMVKNEWSLIDHDTPKSLVSNIWVDGLSKLVWMILACW